MIKGIGADIMLIKDVERAYKKMGWSLIHQYLGPIEIDVFSNLKDDKDEAIMYLARRAAAKESFAKAVNNPDIDLRTVQVLTNKEGQPYIAYNELYGTITHLTLTDCGDYVMAVVVCEAQ